MYYGYAPCLSELLNNEKSEVLVEFLIELWYDVVSKVIEYDNRNTEKFKNKD